MKRTSADKPQATAKHNVTLELCLHGTVLVDGQEVKSPIYMSKSVTMPFSPFVGMDIWMISTEKFESGGGRLVGRVKFVSWDESQPTVIKAHMLFDGDNTHDYLDTRWIINEMRFMGWQCDDEGD